MNNDSTQRAELLDYFNLILDRSLQIASSSSKTTSTYSFEHSVRVYLNKPQVINNWLAGSIIIQDTPSSDELTILLPNFNLASYFNQIEIREFLSKSSKIFNDIRYLVMYTSNLVVFFPIDVEVNKKYPSPSFVHMIEYETSNLNLYIRKGEEEKNNSDYSRQVKWLAHELLPKINNWSMNIKADAEFTCANLNTLKLYDSMINDYWKLYQTMKTTYWNLFNPIWNQLTGTDPKKFIYEDIHIACYLILAWRYFKCDVKCFVDLGCGNGLLVYILNDQGRF